MNSRAQYDPAALVVEVVVKDQYGRQVYHPHSRAAHIFAAIAGTKTLTPDVLKHITDLGLAVLVTREPVQTDFHRECA